MKMMRDRVITRKEFQPGQKVLLYNSRLHLFLENWNHIGPVITLFIRCTHMVQLRSTILQMVPLFKWMAIG